MKAILLLEDGSQFKGEAFGSTGTVFGEVVFNTSLTGYQEVITDPSYYEQIVVMTYPQIGNYGVNEEDFESSIPYLKGFIIKELSSIVSNYRATDSLDNFFKRYGVCGIEGIDTRALTKHIRTAGAMKGVICSGNINLRKLQKELQEYPGLVGRDIVSSVTCKKNYIWQQTNNKYNIIVIDCGVKHNILRMLQSYNCKVTIVPANITASEIFDMKPDGILLSNGPGDPEPVKHTIDTVKRIIDKQIPIFGICLGHQILGLALGARTYKLKFGHHGSNHPVKNLKTGKVEITAQNHGFCVDYTTLNKDEVEITHINLNDMTLEGMEHKILPVFSVQYHPESSPGPHDSRYLFYKFIENIKGRESKNNI